MRGGEAQDSFIVVARMPEALTLMFTSSIRPRSDLLKGKVLSAGGEIGAWWAQPFTVRITFVRTHSIR